MTAVVENIEHLVEKDVDLYITGDFNFGAGESNELSAYLEAKGLVQLVDVPTHKEGNTLDHLYVTDTLRDNTRLKTCYPYYTDHFALCIKFK